MLMKYSENWKFDPIKWITFPTNVWSLSGCMFMCNSSVHYNHCFSSVLGKVDKYFLFMIFEKRRMHIQYQGQFVKFQLFL